MRYPEDPYDDEEQQRKMDYERAAFEVGNFYCEKCLSWASRYLPHDCEADNAEN